jgi:hypothetical protein
MWGYLGHTTESVNIVLNNLVHLYVKFCEHCLQARRERFLQLFKQRIQLNRHKLFC